MVGSIVYQGDAAENFVDLVATIFEEWDSLIFLLVFLMSNSDLSRGLPTVGKPK